LCWREDAILNQSRGDCGGKLGDDDVSYLEKRELAAELEFYF
jgi:hypothetical protein